VIQSTSSKEQLSDTPLTATGTLDGDVRKYRFQIIRPDGE